MPAPREGGQGAAFRAPPVMREKGMSLGMKAWSGSSLPSPPPPNSLWAPTGQLLWEIRTPSGVGVKVPAGSVPELTRRHWASFSLLSPFSYLSEGFFRHLPLTPSWGGWKLPRKESQEVPRKAPQGPPAPADGVMASRTLQAVPRPATQNLPRPPGPGSASASRTCPTEQTQTQLTF